MNDKYDSITENILKQLHLHYEGKICCATCKWLGLFMMKGGYYFTCRRTKYMCELSSLGNWCDDYEEAEDKEWN